MWTRYALIFFVLLSSPAAKAQDEALGRGAEQAGRFAQALTHYMSALQKSAEGSADEQRLREATIRMAARVVPKPEISKEARRFFVRGQTAFKDAKGPVDMEEAAKEFGRAARMAPWWPDAYMNQGIAYVEAGKHADAIRSLKLYLVAAPNAPDAQKVNDQIVALEYRQEKAGKADVAKREEAQRAKAVAEQKAQAEAEMKPGKEQDLNGTWRRSEEKGWKLPQPDGEYVVSIIGTSIEIYNKQFARSDLYQGTVHGSLVKGVVVNRGWTGSPNGEFVAEISEDRRRIKILGTVGEPKVDTNGRVIRGVWDFKGVDVTLIR